MPRGGGPVTLSMPQLALVVWALSISTGTARVQVAKQEWEQVIFVTLARQRVSTRSRHALR